jgi:hypothetical protein
MSPSPLIPQEFNTYTCKSDDGKIYIMKFKQQYKNVPLYTINKSSGLISILQYNGYFGCTWIIDVNDI